MMSGMLQNNSFIRDQIPPDSTRPFNSFLLNEFSLCEKYSHVHYA